MPALFEKTETTVPLAVLEERDRSYTSRYRAHKHIEPEEDTLPIFGVAGASLNIRSPNSNGRLLDGLAHPEHPTSDRAELMELLKRGQSPTWIPARRVNIR